jgi:hypothetical protein
MNNQMIGITGVFALTFFLFVLRHFFLSLGRANKSRYVNPTAPRGTFELNRKAVEDDSWLLWSPDNEAGSPSRVDETTRAARAPRDKGTTPLRFITGR